MLGDSISLEEFDGNENITGRFNGTMNETFEGEWSSPDNLNKFFFKIIVDDVKYEERKTLGITPEDIQVD